MDSQTLDPALTCSVNNSVSSWLVAFRPPSPSSWQTSRSLIPPSLHKSFGLQTCWCLFHSFFWSVPNWRQTKRCVWTRRSGGCSSTWRTPSTSKLVKRANVGESLPTAPSTPHHLSTSTLYKCKRGVKPHMRIWTHVTGSLSKQRFLIGPFEPCDMLEHDPKRIETDSTALCLKTVWRPRN